MKIGIITFHAALNYGSALQAFALQEYVASMGHDVKIIDFIPAAQRKLYPAPVSFNSIYNFKHTIRRLMSGWGEIVFMSAKRKSFRNFRASAMKLTEKTYNAETALAREDWSSYDAIIAGSDQIWNRAAIDSSSAYFIDFADNVIKLSYAPSLGPDPEIVLDSFGVADTAEVRRLLSDFKALSVREQGSADALVHYGLTETLPEVLPDPVLLHDAGFYRSMADESGDMASDRIMEILYQKTSGQVSEMSSGNYVLFYSPGRKNKAAEMLADAAASGMLSDGASSILPSGKRKKILKVSDGAIVGKHIGLYGDGFSLDDNNMLEIPCGPAGFVKLIEGASCTVGTSFHLMVFSMLFGKDFWCPDAALDSRKVQLLSSIGLSSESTFFPFSDPSVRTSIHTALSDLKQKSAEFFQKALVTGSFATRL